MRILFHGVGHYQPLSKPIGPAIWPHYDIIVIQHGEVALTVEEAAMVLCAEDAVVIPPEHTFGGKAVSESAVIWVLHYADFVGDGESPLLSPVPLIIRKAAERSLARKAMEEISRVWKGGDGGGRVDEVRRCREAELLGEWLLLQFGQVARRGPLVEPPRLRETVAHVLEGNLHLEIAEMARHAGYSPSRFRKLFTGHYAMSPQQFFSRARIEEAKRLLQETLLPIKEIAPRLGYGEVAAFHRAFKRETSFSPAAWRRQHSGVA